MKICIFGDSIVWGSFDPEGGGWANRLRNHFERNEEQDICVYPLGIRGDSTDDLLERFEVEASARMPHKIIFAIGINDSQYVHEKGNYRVPLEKFAENTKRLISLGQSFTPDVQFVGLTRVEQSKTMPIPWSPTKYYDNESVEVYDESLQKTVEAAGLSYISVAKTLSFGDLHDGLHPNVEGHRKLFEDIRKQLTNIPALR